MGYVDHIEAIELVSLSSMTALLRQVLDRELTLLSEMAHWLGMGPGRPIKQARVDTLTIQGSKKCIARAREMAGLR